MTRTYDGSVLCPHCGRAYTAETATERWMQIDTPNPKETLRNLYRRHGLPRVKVGGVEVFIKKSVDQWLAEQETRPERPRRLSHAGRNARRAARSRDSA
jgi:uncharacterized Zn finger protein (UPF0148 family)